MTLPILPDPPSHLLFIFFLLTLPLLLFTLHTLSTYIHLLLFLRPYLPPGPIPLPLIGNYLLLRLPKPWEIFLHLSVNIYKSPLITVWNGTKPIIVVNDAWTAAELLDTVEISGNDEGKEKEKRRGRGKLYAGRPRMVVMGDLMGDGTRWNQVCLDASPGEMGERWRAHRKLTHSVVGPQAVHAYRALQSDESKILVFDLLGLDTSPSTLKKPFDFVPAIERYSCSIVSVLGWGRRIDRLNDPVAQTALGFMEAVDWVIPGYFLMETIPWLAKLPAWIYGMPTGIRMMSGTVLRYFYALSCEAAEDKREGEGKGDGRECFAKKLLGERKERGLTDGEIAFLTGNLIGGGVDTTSSTLISFVLAMVAFPDVQRRAHEELDQKLGQDRSFDWHDEGRLPYVSAIVSEVLRWRTVTVLGGIPHAPVRNDLYQQYFILKGTSITANMWAIHRNPNDFPEPDMFKPERFLEGHVEKKPYPNNKGHNAFGFGRRVCSGQALAEQGLWIAIARLLWAFEIKPGLDKIGEDIPVDVFAYTAGENMRPLPFEARFIPRSDKVEALIHQEAKIAKEELRVYDGETQVTMTNC